MSVYGPPGVGRSALLQHVLRSARAAGIATAFSRCSPLDADIPYAAVLQLSAVLHEPAGFADLAAASCAADGDAAMGLMSEAFAELAAAAPLVLVVDDVQWADAWSLRWFDVLSHSAQKHPLLLATATYGRLTRHSDNVPAFDDARPVPLREFRLAPLGPAGTTRMLRDAFGAGADEDFIAAAAGITRGYPAVVREVADRFAETGLRAVREGIPDLSGVGRAAWSERAARVMSGLSAGALELLRVLAVGGDGSDFRMACALVGSGTDLQAALEQLVVAGLATELPAPRVASPYLAIDVLEAMPVAEREELYLRAAVFEHRAGAASGRVADLLCATRPVGQPWAGTVLAEAAAERARQGRLTEAAEALRRALAEPMSPADREAALTRLAGIEVTYAPEASDGRLRQILHESPCSPAAVVAADLLLSRGDAGTTREVALTSAGRERGPEEVRQTLTALGRFAHEEAPAEPDAPFALADLPAGPPRNPAQAGVLAWQLAVRATDRERVRLLAADALAARHDTPLIPRLAACRALLCCDDLDQAVVGLDAVLVAARRRDARAAAAQALLYRAVAAVRGGRPEDAVRDLAAATRELPLQSWHPELVPRLVAGRLGAEVALGRLDLARAIAAEPLPPGADAGVGWAFLLSARGAVRLAGGDPAGALGPLRECGRILRSRHWHNPMLSPWRTLAGISLHLLGDSPAAQALFAEESALAQRWGTGFAVQTHRDRIMARAGHDDVDRAAGPGFPCEALRSSASLSPAEREVAELAARGTGNREIAAELSIAVRTVELRLTKVYRKLGLGGRAELVDAWMAEA
ncbi:AAA family ATPase [Amycolatopsis benzoatilytica]|uniref:AAA family ATPase n=1 Tax=Amycolatopsis benzoatilytica TaxID=346045 RepID=UPI0004827E92